MNIPGQAASFFSKAKSGFAGNSGKIFDVLKNPLVRNIGMNVVLPLMIGPKEDRAFEAAVGFATMTMSPLKALALSSLARGIRSAAGAPVKLLDHSTQLQLQVSTPFSQSGQSMSVAGSSLQYGLAMTQSSRNSGLEAINYARQYTNNR